MQDEQTDVKGILTTVAYIILGFLALSVLAGAWSVVPPGTEGYKVTLGSVHEEPLEPGLHLKIPWIQSIDELSTRTEAYTMSATTDEGARLADDSIEALTTEGLNIHVDLTVRYHMNEGNAPRVYEDIGEARDIELKIVRPTIRSAVRSCSSQYSVNAIYSDKRDAYQSCISNKTNAEFERINGFEVEAVQLRNIRLPDKVRDAIQEKEATQQQIERKDNQIEVEKKERQRRIIEAKGIAQSNRIIGRSLSDAYLKWYWIQEGLKKGDAMYVPIGQGGLPLFKDVDQQPRPANYSDVNASDLNNSLQGFQ